MKRSTTFLAAACIIAATATTSHAAGQAPGQSYMPLLEEGKEWNYKMICHDALTYENFHSIPGINEFRRTLKVEGTTEIDGVTYYNINEYVALPSGESSSTLDESFDLPESNPVFYLHEDNVTGIVSLSMGDKSPYYPNGTFKGERMPPLEGILYDFLNTAGTHDNSTLGDLTLETEAGTLRGYSVDSIPNGERLYRFDNLLVVEGIGFLDGATDSYRYGCDLAGEALNWTLSFPDGMYYPHLGNVRLADGTILYNNPEYSWDTDALTSTAEYVRISRLDGCLVVESTGLVRLYDCRGTMLTHTTSDGRCSIDISRMARGLYILEAGGKTHKIIF